MQKAVGIKFKGSNKIYHFEPNDERLVIGDEVVVDTVNGIAIGEVATNVLNVNSDEEFKKIIRKLTDKDRQKRAEFDKKAQNDAPKIEKMIKDLGLVMKVSKVEYAFDGSKLTISFTADGRVDFRELLKGLASEFKTRIELRQIGSRDEVKEIGGLGMCGQPCCCTRFGYEPEHVSVKMAKNQGLSLNPTKINGLCGRLMCCLAYENATYAEILSRMPKLNSWVTTPDGRGTVVYNDILKELVQVKFVKGEDSMEIKTYPLSAIKLDNLDKNKDNKNETKKENNDGIQD